MKFLSNLFKRKDKEVITEVEEEATIYDELKLVEVLCEKYLDLSEKRSKKIHILNNTSELLNSIKKYEHVDSKTHKRILELMKEYKKIKESKDNLKSHILEQNKKLEHLSHYTTEDMKKIIDEIDGLEKERDILKGDLNKLGFEKENLKDYYEDMVDKYKYLVMGLQSCVIISALVLTGLVISCYLQNEKGILYAGIGSILFVILSSAIYIYKNYLKGELKVNNSKQVKEIGMTNKIKIKYVNVCNLLDFKYKKYNIKSLTQLKVEWGKYQDALNKKSEYDKLFHEFFDIEEHLEKLLKYKNITFDDDIDMIEGLNDLSEKMKIKDESLSKKVKLEKELHNIEVEQGKIAGQLKELENKDETEQKVVKKLIDSYLVQIKDINMEA